MIRILVADDHALLRQGIASVLADEPDLELVAEASDGRSAIDLFTLHRPDVTLMDLRMPNIDGMHAIAAIRRISSLARIIVITTYVGDVQALEALKAGAAGYLPKSTLRKELVDAIRAVHSGKKWIPAEVATAIAEHAGAEALTSREIEVLKLAAQGNSNRAIAQMLGVSESTAKAHMKNILPKLGANDRTHAVTIAFLRGIISDL